MTNLKGNLKKTLGELYGLRTWLEYAFRQCKQELGWTDYRLKIFQQIEKWWSMIFCAYIMISLNFPAFLAIERSQKSDNYKSKNNSFNFEKHEQWNPKKGWKNVLNNLRLIIQPILLFWFIFPWIDVFY